MIGFHRPACYVLLACALAATPRATHAATEWHVAPGGSGTGSRSAPFGRIQDGLAAAQPGDTVHVARGTYEESLHSIRDGSADRRITVRAVDGRGSVVITASGRVLTVAHTHHTIEDLVLDGQYGSDDIVRVETGGHGFTLRGSEVRRTSRDGIDIDAPADVLIEGALVHHTLNASAGRTDAHGIVAGAARRLTIRHTEVHTFSGDAFQIDPGRADTARFDRWSASLGSAAASTATFRTSSRLRDDDAGVNTCRTAPPKVLFHTFSSLTSSS